MADGQQASGSIASAARSTSPNALTGAAHFAPARERSVNPWLIAVVVSLAAFMEVLDTSIANVALPHIAGDMGASNDESTWVLTSYLVSNAIVLPISGWFVGMLGRKRFFMICILLFTVSSLFCGIAWSLGFLLLARVIQGAGGGGLQPMAQAILADSFPPEKRGVAFSVYGVTAICAPAIGPTLGGWITDNYSWRWIFYINLPVGILALLLVYRLIEDPAYIKRATKSLKVDYIGFGLLAIGIGALQILLDKGQEDDWFGSRFITTLTVIAAVCLITLVIYEWFQKDPIVDVRLFKNSNFGVASLMMFMVGALSFASTVLMPQYLQTLMGYTAESAGLVLSGAALLLLVELPIVGQLTTRIQGRLLIAFGWMALCVAMFYSTKRLDLEISFGAATQLRIWQYVPLGFIFIPATTAAYIGIAGEKNNAVAGLVNFMRNIGSSVGTSAVTTILARRAQYHQGVLTSHTSIVSGNFASAVQGLARQLAGAGLNAVDAQRQATARLYAEIRTQASTLAYLDTYWVLGAAAAIMFVMSFLLKANRPGAGGSVAMH
jgi:MFS transporter, DHA2 family, multidrug resistance protein